MADLKESLKTDEQRQNLQAAAQKRLAELENTKKQLNLTAPIVGKDGKQIKPGDMTFEQRKAIGEQSRALNKEMVDLRDGLSALGPGPTDQPNEASMLTQLTAYGIDPDDASELMNQVKAGNRVAVSDAVKTMGMNTQTMGNATQKSAIAFAKTLDNMAERAALEKGDTRGPMSMLGGGVESDFVMPGSAAKMVSGPGGVGIDKKVIESAGRALPGEDGPQQPTRAFTNITPGGQIQEIAGKGADIIEVTRKRDGVSGWLPRDRFDPEKFVEVSKNPQADPVATPQAQPAAATAPAPVTAQPKPFASLPPSPLTGLPGEGLYNSATSAMGIPAPGTIARMERPNTAQMVKDATGMPTNEELAMQLGGAVKNSPLSRLAEPVMGIPRKLGSIMQAESSGLAVRDKITGETFRIPKELYNPNMYDLLPMGQRSAGMTPLGF